jgi:nitric oxide dioxygenase
MTISTIWQNLLYTFEKGISNDFTPDVRKAWIVVYKIIAEVTGMNAYSNFDASIIQK